MCVTLYDVLLRTVLCILQTIERVRTETRAEENKAVKKHYEAIVAQLTKEKEEVQTALATTLQRVSYHCFRWHRLQSCTLSSD